MSELLSTEQAGLRLRRFTVTIPSGAAVPAAPALYQDLGGYTPIAILMPPAWTAANLTFRGTIDGSTLVDVYDSTGTELTVTAAASRYVVFTSAHIAAFAGLQGVTIRSGTAGVPVNQGGARTLYLIGRRIE
jgi:hypothetical protein